MGCGSKGIASPVVPTDFEAGDGIAIDDCNPVVISTTGHSFLTDELGNKLTDEAGVPLEGKDTVDANLLVNKGPTIKPITFADSPYQATVDDDIITVDASGGETIIILYPLFEEAQIRIKKKDSSAFKVIYKGSGFNIDGLSQRELSLQYNSDKLVGEATEWGRY